MARRVAIGVVAALVACGSRPGPPEVPSPLWQPAPTASGPSGAPSYDVVDLGDSFVFSIDPFGRVSGGTWQGAGIPAGPWDSRFTAGVYTPGSGWSSVPIPEGASFALPIGIDAAGRVALNVYFPYPFALPPKANPNFARAYAGSPPRPLLAPGESATSYATSMVSALDSSTGQIVGYDDVLGGGFLFDGATMIPVAAGRCAGLAGSSALALNGREQVVGWMRVPGAPCNAREHAFLWNDGAAPVDLGAIGPCSSKAVGVNAAGLVVGDIQLGSYCGELAAHLLSAVFLWDGRMRILGCPGSAVACEPRGINARGDIVGSALVDGERGFILRDGTFQWLDDIVAGASGWRFDGPVGINDAGAITGQGTLNGAGRAFVLVPR